MYWLENWHKVAVVALLAFGYAAGSARYFQEGQVERTEAAMAQLGDGHAEARQRVELDRQSRGSLYALGWGGVGLLGFLLFAGDLRRALRRPAAIAAAALCLVGSGCRKSFEPVKLEVIQGTEEAFLLPLTGDGRKQSASSNEEYLKEKLVYTQQVQIPQQWVQTGHNSWLSHTGEWRDAALLVKVSKSPETREWTADPNSGTSNKNEAIWVMTSDQVEFSTGWTVTARIANRDDAVKFLHNYPNGSLKTVLDTEARAKLQAEFGLAVTDLPMETLRKAATPVITKVVKGVTEFFKERGITITNLGISGGFVYKDKSIIDTMVKVFNAEQERAVAAAKTNAQEELNKSVILEAQGKADAIMKTKKAEADGIRMVAEARAYEIEKARQDLPAYLSLKQLELQKEQLQKWDGQFPRYFLGSGGGGPNMLLQLPPLEAAASAAAKK